MIKKEVKEEFKQLKESVKDLLVGSVVMFLITVVSILVIFGPTIALAHITGFPIRECAPIGLFATVMLFLLGRAAIGIGKDARKALFEKDKDSK